LTIGDSEIAYRLCSTSTSFVIEDEDGGDRMSSANQGMSDLTDAVHYLELALQILDANDAPAQIGAHLDLALCQLREHTRSADDTHLKAARH